MATAGYNLLGLSNPDQAAPVGRDQQFFTTWGQQMTGGLNNAMTLGTRLNQYGASQRMAPLVERNVRMGLDNSFLRGANDSNMQINAMRVSACHAAGWSTAECQQLRLMMVQDMGIDPAQSRPANMPDSTASANSNGVF